MQTFDIILCDELVTGVFRAVDDTHYNRAYDSINDSFEFCIFDESVINFCNIFFWLVY